MNKRISKEQEIIVKKLYIKNKLSGPLISKRCNLSLSQIYDALYRHNIVRRDRALQNEIRFRSSALSYNFLNSFSLKQRELLIAGIMLYWGEGKKTGVTVDFTNTNLKILKLFLSFLRIICGIKEEKLRIYLYCFQGQNIHELISFWAHNLMVDPKSFTKPYVRQSKGITLRQVPNGVVHIRYSDKRLLEKILSLCEELGTQLIL